MKKAIVLVSLLLLASGLCAAGTGSNLVLNLGVMTDDGLSFSPFIWTAGLELDLQLGKYLMLSPEVTLAQNGFKFKEFLLFPGAVLNFTPGSFFVGGGLVKGIYIGSGQAFVADDFSLKLNAGFLTEHLKLTAYAITTFDNLFSAMLVGASLGFRF